MSRTRGGSVIADSHRFWLVFGIVACLALRMFAASHMVLPDRDTSRYALMARNMDAGPIEGLLSYYPPGFPALIRIFQPMVGDPVLAAQLVSAVAAAAGLIPLHMLTAWFLGRPAAVVCSVLYALHPVLIHYGASAISESLFTSLLLFALWFSCRSHANGGRTNALATGVFGGMAFLTRPEGMGILLVVLALSVLRLVRPGGARRASLVGRSLLVVAGFGVAAGPYLVFMRLDTDSWLLTLKEEVSVFGVRLGILKYLYSNDYTPMASIPARRVPENLVESRETQSPFVLTGNPAPRPEVEHPKRRFRLEHLQKFSEALMGSFVLLLVAGIVVSAPRSLTSAVAVHLAACLLFFFLLYWAFYPSRRHLGSLVPFCLPWCAAGLMCCVSHVRRRGGRALSGPIVAIVILAACVYLARFLRPYNAEKAPRLVAGLWAREKFGAGLDIMADDERVAFFACGRPRQEGETAGLARLLWVQVTRPSETPHVPRFARSRKIRMVLLARHLRYEVRVHMVTD